MKNNLKNLSFDTRLEESLYNFEKMGSVVEFLLIDNSNNNLIGNEIELVLFTVKTIRERAYAKFYEKQGLLNILDPEITKKEYEQNKDKLIFTKVTPDEFFSPIYSITDKKFVFGKLGQDGINGDEPMPYEKFVEY